MKKTILLLALAIAAALVAANVAASRESSRRVITVLSRTTGLKVLQDKAPSGESKGDVLSGSSLLRNAVAQFGKPKGAAVGRDHWRAVLQSATVAAYRVTVTLPGGTLVCRGKDYGRGRIVLRVVAASGAFAGATGTCVATPAPTNPYGADSLNTYRLSK